MTVLDPVTFSEMRWAVHSESRRIDITQDYLIETGARKRPDEGQLRMKHIFDEIERLIDIIVADTIIIDRIKQNRIRQQTATTRGSENSAGVAVADG